MPACSATVEAFTRIDRQLAFDRIAAVDLPSAFVGFGPLPAVTGVAEGASPWERVGQRRTLLLADGSTATEELREFASAESFAYRVSNYSSVLRWVVDHAQARWEFKPVGEQCRIRWTYSYYARSWLAAPLVWLILRTLWTGYMRRSIRRCVTLIERA